MKKIGFLILAFMIILLLSGAVAYLSPFSAITGAKAVISDSRQSVPLPVLMYHGVTDDPSQVSEYTISAELFESDLKWLGDNGFTTVSAGQIIDYVENGAALPDKPVLITFDDGYANNYSVAFPLLEKYHMNAIVSVIGSQSDLSSGDIYRSLFNSNLTWGEIALMYSSGAVEIGNHTYDMHSANGERRGASKKAGEGQEAYSDALTEDLTENQDRIMAATGQKPTVFAWPFGEYPMDGSADEILKSMGFKMTLISYQKMNEIKKGDPDCLFGLKRFLRTPDFDMNKIIW